MTVPTIIMDRLGPILPRIPRASVPATVPPPENAAADTVGVYDEDFNQLFENARPVKGGVYEASKIMDHPVESGGTITDHSVIEPVEIELYMMLAGDEYRNTYNQIKALFKQRALLTVQTKTGSYTNMLIAEIPHEESPDTYDMIPLSLRLREVILVVVQFQALPPKAVAVKRNASTVKRGQQTGKAEPVDAATGKKPSTVALDIYNYFGGGP